MLLYKKNKEKKIFYPKDYAMKEISNKKVKKRTYNEAFGLNNNNNVCGKIKFGKRKKK